MALCETARSSKDRIRGFRVNAQVGSSSGDPHIDPDPLFTILKIASLLTALVHFCIQSRLRLFFNSLFGQFSLLTNTGQWSDHWFAGGAHGSKPNPNQTRKAERAS